MTVIPRGKLSYSDPGGQIETVSEGGTSNYKDECGQAQYAQTDFHIHMFWACTAESIESASVIGTGVSVDEMHIRRNTLIMFLCDSKQIYRSDQSLEKYSLVKSESNLHWTDALTQNHVVYPKDEIETLSQPTGNSPLTVSLMAPNFLQSVSTKHNAGQSPQLFIAQNTYIYYFWICFTGLTFS